MSYDMTEIEKRLSVAAAYRTLLNEPLLPQTEVNDLVVAEVKEFVHGRLELILGVRPAENPSVHFSGMEIVALKSLARKLLDPPKEEPTKEQATVSKPVVKRAPKPKKAVEPKRVAAAAPVPKEESPEQVSSPDPITTSQPLPENIVVENGRTYEYVDVGGKKFAKDITKQATSKTAKPMPTKAQFETMMYTNAMQELASTASNPIVGAAVQATINKG